MLARRGEVYIAASADALCPPGNWSIGNLSRSLCARVNVMVYVVAFQVVSRRKVVWCSEEVNAPFYRRCRLWEERERVGEAFFASLVLACNS